MLIDHIKRDKSCLENPERFDIEEYLVIKEGLKKKRERKMMSYRGCQIDKGGGGRERERGGRKQEEVGFARIR